MRMIKVIWLFLFITIASYAGEPREGDGYALVIIDMQPLFVTRGGYDKTPENTKKVQEILENQKKMIHFAKTKSIPIIFIEYQNQGDTTSELKAAAEGYKYLKYFTKTTDGMFDDGNTGLKSLSDYLRSEGIGNLIISGANGGACVSESITGALHYNYNVTAYNEGIADFNYKEFIFPYVNKYDFKPTCKNCSFEEIRDYATLSMKFSMKIPLRTSGVKNVKINNSLRDINKDIPISVPNSKQTRHQTETKAQ